jgi:hypothetical protein
MARTAFYRFIPGTAVGAGVNRGGPRAIFIPQTAVSPRAETENICGQSPFQGRIIPSLPSPGPRPLHPSPLTRCWGRRMKGPRAGRPRRSARSTGLQAFPAHPAHALGSDSRAPITRQLGAAASKVPGWDTAFFTSGGGRVAIRPVAVRRPKRERSPKAPGPEGETP